MKKQSQTYESFTKRSFHPSSQQFPSEQSRLTNEPLNYSFRKQLQIPQFKQMNQIQMMARINRDQQNNQNIQKRMARIQSMMNKIMNTNQLNMQVTRNNERRIQKMQSNIERILHLLQKGKQESNNFRQKQNDFRCLNTDLSKPRLSDMYSQKCNTVDSYQDTITKKLKKTRSIITIQDRKKEIDKEISMRLKQESAKRKKILHDLRKQQSYSRKFF